MLGGKRVSVEGMIYISGENVIASPCAYEVLQGVCVCIVCMCMSVESLHISDCICYGFICVVGSTNNVWLRNTPTFPSLLVGGHITQPAYSIPGYAASCSPFSSPAASPFPGHGSPGPSPFPGSLPATSPFSASSSGVYSSDPRSEEALERWDSTETSSH